MNPIEMSINRIIDTHHEQQYTSKRLIHIGELEREVRDLIGSVSEYKEWGGYKYFQKTVQTLIVDGCMKRLTKPMLNGKTPTLYETYWLMPKYTQHTWDKKEIAKVSSYLDLRFFLRNKKMQTEEEWNHILVLYKFMKEKECHSWVNREERSLMLFIDQVLPEEVDAEKFLSSSRGRKLLQRLSLTLEDLKCQIVREPFHYYKNVHVPAINEKEVLIVEGLNTFNTLKNYLERQYLWSFGPAPHYLIWGEGYRIESTIDYLNDISVNPEELVIRYAGDIDYDGLSIYVELKQKNSKLSIQLSETFYNFMIEHADKFQTDVVKNQRANKKYLNALKKDLSHQIPLYEGIERLWNNRMRIAQECINFETLYQRGVF